MDVTSLIGWRDWGLGGRPLVNQLIEADRRRQIIDPCSVQPGPAPAREVCPPPPVHPLPAPPAEPAPPQEVVVVRTRYVPVYHLGTMLDVFA